ncbi:MAG: prolipoprotein diacylglyceryl transferase [Pyrinomonadaceae bacterium]
MYRYVHNIDPIILSIGGVHVWWYGLGFSLGFLNMRLALGRASKRLDLIPSEVWLLSVLFALGVLIGGRSVVVFNNEWDFYGRHLYYIPAFWLGGFASHGLIAGGATATAAFAWIKGKDMRRLFDAIAPAACFILACGRIGNFIDGQIAGMPTDSVLGVKFPEAEGYRHAVVLYDGIKNLLLIPFLIWLERRDPFPGRTAAWFVLLYSGLRIPIDMFRDYPIFMWGFPTGQTLNLLMFGIGIVLVSLSCIRERHGVEIKLSKQDTAQSKSKTPRYLYFAFALLLILPPLIPSDATRDIPARYGKRHRGLAHTTMYPEIDNEVNQ